MNNYILCLPSKPVVSIPGQRKVYRQSLGFVLMEGMLLSVDVSVALL